MFDPFADHEAPAPVVPEDLHLVKAVSADSAGNVECLYCKKAVPYGEAEATGSEGMACVPCYVNAVPRIDELARKQLRREGRQRLKLGVFILLAMFAYFAIKVWVADSKFEQEEPVFQIELPVLE